jgi:hypothetical protein
LESLRSAIDKARSCGVTENEAALRRALTIVVIFEKVSAAESALKRAVDAGDLEGLQYEVRNAEDVMATVRSEGALVNSHIEVGTLSTAQSLIQSLTKQKQVTFL